MKSSVFRTVAMLLAIISIIPVFTACASSDPSKVTTEPINTTESSDTNPETTTELAVQKTYLTINAANASAVTLVRPADVPRLSTLRTIYSAFRREINKRFAAEFGVATDSDSNDPATIEILVGDTTRDESVALAAKLDALDSYGFGITVTGNRIAVSGTNLYLTYVGLDYLLCNLTSTDETGKLQLKLEDGFEYIEETEYDYPTPEEVMNSGRKYAFYSIEKLADVPTEGNYSVLQGGGSDGKYAYYAMIDPTTSPETALFYKYDMATWELEQVAPKPVPSAHSNDITYDPKNNRLVISYCSATDGYKGLVFADPDTLEFIEYIVCPTSNHGVCYLPETDQYLFATGYVFHLTDENFNTIRSLSDGFPELTTQGIYCDGKYIYAPRWESGARAQTITINTLDGRFIGAIPSYNIDGEPENIFRDGNTFVMGCNGSNAVFRIALLYENWWE